MKRFFILFVSIFIFASMIYADEETITDKDGLYIHSIKNSDQKDFKQVKLALAECFENPDKVIKFSDSDLGIIKGSGNYIWNIGIARTPLNFDFDIQLEDNVVTIKFYNYSAGTKKNCKWSY